MTDNTNNEAIIDFLKDVAGKLGRTGTEARGLGNELYKWLLKNDKRGAELGGKWLDAGREFGEYLVSRGL